MYKYLFFICLVHVSIGQNEHKRPNFVIILTDDQDVELGGMTPMQNVRRFIAQEGVTFTNSYVASPICCPSRASLLTGMYVHNHMVQNNSISGGCYGSMWKRSENRNFAVALKEAGYNTFYAGKYMNQYGTNAAGGPEIVPPGWTEWHGLVGNSVYYNFTISSNGIPTHTTDEYLTDVIRELSISYIENQTESQPFLMVLAPPAPHQPFTPAPRHKDLFKNITAIRHPNFNVASEDKHWLMRMPPSPLPESVIPELDRVYRSRWEALLAVDEMVADVVGSLEAQSLLENTYLIYTSDNGYHVGQFSQVYDKRQPYEADIKVPLIIRGPNLEKNVINRHPTINIDIAPSILQWAGLEIPKYMDGRPVSLQHNGLEERNMLIEYYGEGNTNTVDENCPWKYDGRYLSECYPQYECKCQDAKNNTFGCVRHIAERINRKFCIFADQELSDSDTDIISYLFPSWHSGASSLLFKLAGNEIFSEMYDLNQDPYELKNIANEVFPSVRHWYKLLVSQLLTCKGADNCDHPLSVYV